MRAQLFFLLSAALSAPAWAYPASADRADCARPEWPKESLQHSEQGTVTLALLVEADGKVSASKVVKSSGHPLLDAAAREALAKCSYQPQVVLGKPQMGWQLQQYKWTAEEAQ
jgi:TonB family protein